MQVQEEKEMLEKLEKRAKKMASSLTGQEYVKWHSIATKAKELLYLLEDRKT